jgi:hypothetical protein
MAKRKKVKSKSKSKKPQRRVRKSMATKRKRRKGSSRKSISRSVSVPRKRRKKRGFLSSVGGSSLMQCAKHNAMGALGGSLLLATKFIPVNKWLRTGIAYAGSIAVSKYVNPFMGAGLAGATTIKLLEGLFPAMALNDGEMEDAKYIDPDTLSDTGMDDDNGNPILADSMGNAYALNENNELEEMEEGFNMKSVSMLPLQEEAYPGNAFALSSSYGY